MTDFRVTLRGKPSQLFRAWQTHFQPHLDTFAEPLAPMLGTHLQQAYLFPKQHHALFDPISFGRAAIEPHPQDRYRTAAGTELLVDAARDSLGWLVHNRAVVGNALIELWCRSDAPLLQRLALFGVTESTWDADSKIAWLLRQGWLYTYGLKHEVFRLLRLAYPLASTRCRLDLLRTVRRGPRNTLHGDDLNAYAIWELLGWLAQAAPECQLAARRFGVAAHRHPTFEAREYPDFDHPVSAISSVAPQSPLSEDELLLLGAEEALLKLRELYELVADNIPGGGIALAATEAVARSAEWGLGLAEALALAAQQDAELWDHRLWQCIFWGWQTALTTDEHWTRALALLEVHGDLGVWTSDVAPLLDVRSAHHVPDSLEGAAEGTVDLLWAALTSGSHVEGSTGANADDWYAATRHAGGVVVASWLWALSKKQQEMREQWTGLPKVYRTRFAQVLANESFAAQAGRVTLAHNLSLLFSIDEIWTREHLLPLFRWASDRDRAQQAWQGYLAAAPVTTDLASEMMPLYEEAFEHVQRDLGAQRDRISYHLAVIALFGWRVPQLNPVRSGWLARFLRATEAPDRAQWANSIELLLQSLPQLAISAIWEGWLREYVTQRGLGQPVPIEQDEYEHMVAWLISLNLVFDEAVERMCDLSAIPLQHMSIYHELHAKDCDMEHPRAVARLLLHLLQPAQRGNSLCHWIDPIVERLLTSIPVQEIERLLNEMARLGCPHAATFRQRGAGS